MVPCWSAVAPVLHFALTATLAAAAAAAAAAAGVGVNQARRQTTRARSWTGPEGQLQWALVTASAAFALAARLTCASSCRGAPDSRLPAVSDVEVFGLAALVMLTIVAEAIQ